MADSAPPSRLQLPGFGLPLNFIPYIAKDKQGYVKRPVAGDGGVIFRNAFSSGCLDGHNTVRDLDLVMQLEI